MYRVSGAQFQSGALPYRVDKAGRRQVLLVTSARSSRWTIPKGWVVPGLSLAENAAKEAMEEAGVVGKVAARSAGSYRAIKRLGAGTTIIDVWVFLLAVTATLDDWPEKRHRRIKWVSPATAARLLREPLLQRLCRQLGDG
jgi:8-oxo-dGTP pyrophosphatase MutT (NUDIX family)